MNTSPWFALAMRPRSDSATRVSVVRVISTSIPRACKAAASFFATDSVTSFSTNHAGVPIGPVIPLSGPPWPASTTTSLRDGLVATVARGGGLAGLTDSAWTGLAFLATAVDDAAEGLGGEVDAVCTTTLRNSARATS